MNVLEIRRQVRRLSASLAAPAVLGHVADFTVRVFETRAEARRASEQLRRSGEAEVILVGRSVAFRHFD